MRILKIDRLRVPEIRGTPKIHNKLKTHWPEKEEKENVQRKKKDSKKSVSDAEQNTKHFLSEIEEGTLEGVKNSLEHITIDGETVIKAIIREGVGKNKIEIPIVIRKMPEDYFEIYLPHAPAEKDGPEMWKNYLVKSELINKLFGIGIDFKA